MNRTTKLKITELNAHLMCVLCGGYFIDATTIVECLHSFCKTCIVRYLESSRYCPVCDTQVHKTRPLQHIRADKTLQTIVYKLVPGLYRDEMTRRRTFYESNPDSIAQKSAASNAEDVGKVEENFIYKDDEKISISLHYHNPVTMSRSNGTSTCKMTSQSDSNNDDDATSESNDRSSNDVRYLRCPAAVTVHHIKKFIRGKFGLPLSYEIDIMYRYRKSEEALIDHFTLMDIAYLYDWRRQGPMALLYRVRQPPIKNLRPSQHTLHSPTASPSKDEHKKSKIARVDKAGSHGNKDNQQMNNNSNFKQQKQLTCES
ncbi:polycomb complex protein BMI-1-A-like [Glandiceps talaboti]